MRVYIQVVMCYFEGMDKPLPNTPSSEDYEALLAENSNQQTIITDLQKQVKELLQSVEQLRAMLRLAQQERFGRSSEKKHINPDQISIFNEAEMEADASPSEEEPTLETVVVRRKKTKGKRDADLSVLPQEIIEHKLAEKDRHCPTCDTVMDECGVTDHNEVIYVPATVKVKTHRQYAYACPCCKHNGDKAEVMRAPMPRPLLPKSLVSPSLLAHIASEKYDKAVPLYRIERTFADKRFHLPRQTMARWIIKVHEEYLAGFFDVLHKQFVMATHAHADETEVQVLNEPDRDAKQKSRMWVYRTGRGAPPLILFDYQETRHGEHAVRFLDGFCGTLQVDGYSGYNALPDTVILAGCVAHMRRHFIEAERALPKGSAPEQRADLDEVIGYIGQLYAIEQNVDKTVAKKHLDKEDALRWLHAARQTQSRPIFDTLYRRLRELEGEVLPRSYFGKAITYALNQESMLRVYLDDPLVDIDNNACERSIRPFVTGRKNWMFSDTPAGAKASACYYSIVETAKANGLDAYSYMNWLLSALAQIDNSEVMDYERCFPWSPTVQSHCQKMIKPR